MSLTSMDSSEYLKSYGWEEGEALRKGGLKKPILVKHKRDKKGLGSAPGNDDSEAWWERLFDGHLKNLEVGTDSKKKGIVFKQNKVTATAVSKQSSPLYQRFVKGEGLQGTIREKKSKVSASAVIVSDISKSNKRSRSDDSDSKKHKKHKKAKKNKKEKVKDKHKHKHKHTDGKSGKKSKKNKDKKHHSKNKE